MKLQRTARDYYAVEIAPNPPIEDATWEASFDGGATWHDGVDGADGWTWLVAGPDFDADAVGQQASDTVAVIAADTQPLLRCQQDPVVDVERERVPIIRLKG